MVDLSVFIGTNGCGKTAALLALVRLFGLSNADRRLTLSDFHRPWEQVPEEIDEASLSIEVCLDFPELADDAEVPTDLECFNQMLIEEPGGNPYCRLRLEGIWRRSSLPEGDIEERIFWVTAPYGGQESDEDYKAVQAHERSRIHVLYVPAARDPTRQTRQVSGAVLHRLMRAVEWSDEVRRKVEKASEKLQANFREEKGVQEIRDALVGVWHELHEMRGYTELDLRPVGRRHEDLLKSIEVVFQPSGHGPEQPLECLSDGLKSLFYFALVGAEFRIAEEVRENDAVGAANLSADELRLPLLTIFAIEEPENHLAPHYLGRILTLLREMAEAVHGQVLLTSQSPGILGRVDPTQVRYFRLDLETQTTLIQAIQLPTGDQGEVYKFVKEAVRAFPELYFAKLVVLCEGDSEEVVLARVARACGLSVDSSFVSVVPLGGRHVNHFWRLLDSLNIPFVTLLDLDRERQGGGWGRIKYACKQLLEIGRPKEEVLQIILPDGNPSVLSDANFEVLNKRDVTSTKLMKKWTDKLEKFDVFFSGPLDLDFMMLRAFPEAYHGATTGSGPHIPEYNSTEYQERVDAAQKAVLKDGGSDGSTYSDDDRDEFIWYSYLFLGRGKPATHILALNSLTEEELCDEAPGVLHRLVDRMSDKLAAAPPDEELDF